MTENTGNTPFLSIITVTKNDSDGLQRTSAGVQRQTCQDFEWIVIDGDSGPQTTDFLKQTEANWVSEPDSGIYDAMNKGIERAKGQFILFLNAGDTFADNTVIEQVKAASSAQTDFIFGDSYEFGRYKPARSSKIEYGMFTHHQAMLYRRDKLGELRYDLRYEIASDYDFTARFLQANPNTLHLPLAICEFQPGGISQQQANLGRAEQHQIRKELKLCSNFKNAFITGVQACLWRLRKAVPSLYWRLKSSGNTARAVSQT
ncbi:MAG: glycosyltransferase [Alphaproteobacteria bacterium]|nr:glycosyltransferase [Alphaproteobacteria bacterium]